MYILSRVVKKYHIQLKLLLGVLLLLVLLFKNAPNDSVWNFKQGFTTYAENLDYSDLTKSELDCLCYEACSNIYWDCAVVSCYYDPTNYCSEYYTGECYCGSFGCGRATISNVNDEQWDGCVAEEVPIIDPVTPIDDSGDIEYIKEMKELDKEIKDATLMIRYYIAQKDDGKMKHETKNLVNLMNKKAVKQIEHEKDLSDEQKKEAIKVIDSYSKSFRLTEKVGEGSKIAGCNCIGFGSFKKCFSECLFVDPLSYPDVIAHEYGHLIYENLSEKYEFPSGDSSHSFFDFSSDQHRALDEAIATLYAMDLNDTTTYSSAYSEANVVIVGAKQTTQDAIDSNLRSTEYSYDFVTDEMLVAYNSDFENFVPFDESDPEYVNFWGWDKNDKTKVKYEKIMKHLSDDLDEKTNQVRKNYYYQKALDRSLSEKDKENYLKSADYIEYSNALKLYQKYKKVGTPVAYSPKGEVAVARLLFDVIGEGKQEGLIGKVQYYSKVYTDKTGKAPVSELDLLKGYMAEVDPNSEEFEEILEIVNSDKHRRNYSKEDLIINAVKPRTL